MYSILIVFIIILLIGSGILLKLEVFGARPGGERLKHIKKSKNYQNGKFKNLSPTPSLAEGYSYPKVIYNFFFRKKADLIPKNTIPAISTDLKNLPLAANLLIWFGHSSYLLQLEGKTILVDPVLNGYASPYRRINKVFQGTDSYKADDLPPIDYLLITHDHYDHLDYGTILRLKEKTGQVVCPLGVGAHFEKWGYQPAQLIEKDWEEKVVLDSHITLYFTPARHFSGRSVFSNNTLWTSYVLETPSRKIFIGGDSGYDKHFAEIGEKFGGFDLAILENGQYNEAWRYIHTLPEEVLQASRDLKARRLFPVHAGKFNLGGHPWYEPFARITALNRQDGQTIITPMIGETVDLDNEKQTFKNWWEEPVI